MKVEFEAMVQGKYDYSTEVFSMDSDRFGKMMVICAEEGAIYITRKQAEDFFDDKPRLVMKGGESYLFIGYHPEHPIVILENSCNNYINITLGEYLELEKIYD